MLLLKIIGIFAGGVVVGIACGILPCYIFPLFGGSTHTWCGMKSEPKYFFVQVFVGFVIGLVAFGWLLFRRPARRT